MAKKAITARIYIGGESVAEIKYETRDNSFHGKKIARLVLDEFALCARECAGDDPWAIIYTDEDGAELALTSTNKADSVSVKAGGETVGTIDVRAYNRVETMWDWLKERGWY